MIYKSRKLNLGEHEVILRSATLDDAEMLQRYISTVCGETRFLLCESDEIGITKEEELEFIERHNESPDEMLILGFMRCGLTLVTLVMRYSPSYLFT